MLSPLLPSDTRGNYAPLVIIKADDLVYSQDGTVFGAAWNRFIEIVERKGIKASIGIICKSLNDGAPEYHEKIRVLRASGQIEFWKHGSTHARNTETGECEFRGPDLNAQWDTISRSQNLAMEKLGFPFASFSSLQYERCEYDTCFAGAS
jgi:hypothetical protein